MTSGSYRTNSDSNMCPFRMQPGFAPVTVALPSTPTTATFTTTLSLSPRFFANIGHPKTMFDRAPLQQRHPTLRHADGAQARQDNPDEEARSHEQIHYYRSREYPMKIETYLKDTVLPCCWADTTDLPVSREAEYPTRVLVAAVQPQAQGLRYRRRGLRQGTR